MNLMMIKVCCLLNSHGDEEMVNDPAHYPCNKMISPPKKPSSGHGFDGLAWAMRDKDTHRDIGIRINICT